MIHLLEKQLLDELRKVHPPELDIQTGPVFPPDSDTIQMLAVTVSKIESRHPALDEDSEHERNPSYQQQSLILIADGSTVDFPLPDTAEGEVAEIESPAGYIIRRGDDYRVEDRVIKFYRAPQADIIVQLRGKRAHGYREQQASRIALNIEAWAETSSDADTIIEASLAAVLAYFVDISVITLASSQSPNVHCRLLKPVARLAGIERTTNIIGDNRFICSIAHLYLYGELELNVALGEQEEEGIIELIEYSIDSGQKA